MELNISLLVEVVVHKFLNSNSGNDFFKEKREYRRNRTSNYSSTKERYKKSKRHRLRRSYLYSEHSNKSEIILRQLPLI
jgi:hypothetical protein